MQSLCDIDLIKSVHEKKIKLIKEEEAENEKKRLEKEILKKKQREEELKRKLEQETLARLEEEAIKHRKRLEKIALEKKINRERVSDADILALNQENHAKEVIEIKKMEFEEEENEGNLVAGSHNILLNNKVDENYNGNSDIDLHYQEILDHDEDYEDEDPDDEEDIENEITDEEILEHEKELEDDYEENNRISSAASSISKGYQRPTKPCYFFHSKYFPSSVCVVNFHYVFLAVTIFVSFNIKNLTIFQYQQFHKFLL